jgi:hypothetical protein
MGKQHFITMWKQALDVDTYAMPIAMELSQQLPPKWSPSLTNPFTRVASFNHLVHVARGLVAINNNFSDAMASLMTRGKVFCHGINLRTGEHVQVMDPSIFYDDDRMDTSYLLERLREYYKGNHFQSPGE